ncbi:TFIIB-type zinc ribbon-containing protein [Humisphaera borealis]|uniref:Zf-TFIIB domain-containing protein n=1 Tax=Humisphaera borealis TaxID=2807512 RepID=A0A7M2WU71_9BACT|nr:zf-TFIIB domain-containing protein [Humisphaera borealis]QOV89058.1 zf-TFIIB domain-containing protein [Humisphaera borealis]
MNCPQCQTSLVMSERQGVEIDYCPQCRGVWLDRGELDKIIERSSMSDDDDDREIRQHRVSPYDGDRKGADYERYPRKKKSFWSELFD